MQNGLSLYPHNSILGMFIPDYMIMYIDKIIMTHGGLRIYYILWGVNVLSLVQPVELSPLKSVFSRIKELYKYTHNNNMFLSSI